MGLIRDEPYPGSETYFATLDDGTEEGDLEVEESIEIRGEIQKQKHFHQ
jgi:hypothetical protein